MRGWGLGDRGDARQFALYNTAGRPLFRHAVVDLHGAAIKSLSQRKLTAVECKDTIQIVYVTKMTLYFITLRSQ